MFPNSLPQRAQESLAVLGKSNLLENAYMAGGSSLAIQIGHRQSVDFDFFQEDVFEPKEIITGLQKTGTFQVSQVTPTTINGEFNKIRFSLFQYPYPQIASTIKYQGVSLASIQDISAMKLSAVTGRGTKKDFIDLYFICQQKYSFEDLLDFYDQKYHLLSENRLTILKSLQYFEDAESSEMPLMIVNLNWEKVKEFFKSETIRLWNKYKQVVP